MNKELGIFIDFLQSKHLKLTSQREEILNYFLKTDRHLTVEDLYDVVKKKDPNIGQATVFRTLKLLREAGLANEVDFGDKKVRYEHKYGREHHGHLICLNCGESIEIIYPEIEKLQNALCRKFKFSPQRHKMEIFGICKDCGTKAICEKLPL